MFPNVLLALARGHENRPIYREEPKLDYSVSYETDYRPAGHRPRDDVSFSASFENNRDESTSFSDSDDVSARTAARNLARVEHEVDNMRNHFPGVPMPNLGVRSGAKFGKERKTAIMLLYVDKREPYTTLSVSRENTV